MQQLRCFGKEGWMVWSRWLNSEHIAPGCTCPLTPCLPACPVNGGMVNTCLSINCSFLSIRFFSTTYLTLCICFCLCCFCIVFLYLQLYKMCALGMTGQTYRWWWWWWWWHDHHRNLNESLLKWHSFKATLVGLLLTALWGWGGRDEEREVGWVEASISINFSPGRYYYSATLHRAVHPPLLLLLKPQAPRYRLEPCNLLARPSPKRTSHILTHLKKGGAGCRQTGGINTTISFILIVSRTTPLCRRMFSVETALRIWESGWHP